MAVLVIADVCGQSAHGYDGMLTALEPILHAAPGFIAHGAGPVGSGWWKSFEIWETQADAVAFFADYVRPNLPADVRPKRAYIELHALVLGPMVELLRGREVDTHVPGLSRLLPVGDRSEAAGA